MTWIVVSMSPEPTKYGNLQTDKYCVKHYLISKLKVLVAYCAIIIITTTTLVIKSE